MAAEMSRGLAVDIPADFFLGIPSSCGTRQREAPPFVGFFLI